MKNGKADSKPMMGGRNRANNMSQPEMGGRDRHKDMHHMSTPAMGTGEGHDHSHDIEVAEGLPHGGRHVGKVSPVMGAKSTHGSKQTDKARAMWTEGINNGHDAHGHADEPMKYTGHAPLRKENPGVVAKAKADRTRRIGGGANKHGEYTVSNQHNNQ